MTTLAAYITFYCFYFVYYASPFAMLSAICQSLGVNVGALVNCLGNFKAIVGFFVLSILLFLPKYRTKLAVAAYGERDMKFWQAHKVSGAILRANLSFLPIVGFVFRTKEKRK